MAGVAPYQKKPGLMQSVLPIAGTVVGGMVGGPVGAAAGGAIGGKLSESGPGPGAVVSDANQLGPNVPNGPFGENITGRAAMERRLAPPPPSQAIDNANQALTQLPPEQQQKYGPILRRAKMLDEQQTGVV